MKNYQLDSDSNLCVTVANNTSMTCQGHGSVMVKMACDGSSVLINDVMHVPELNFNLLSVSVLT